MAKQVPAPKALAKPAPATPEDVALVTEAKGAIDVFIKNFLGFLTTARQLETDALEVLEESKLTKAPVTAADDEQIQLKIKDANRRKKGIADWWVICSKVSQLHRKMTARRDKGVTALEQAALTWNGLHNRYVEAERERVRLEEERRRRVEEEKQRRRRDEELAELEREQLRIEAASPKLSEREDIFVTHYYKSGQARVAALAAGYKEPDVTAIRLLNSVKIQRALDALTNADAIKSQAEAVRTAPVEVETDAVTPNLVRAAGTSSRTSWSGVIVDGAKLLEAYRQGGHGIPADVFEVNQAKLNEYARSLHERLDLWPGVRHKKVTGVV